MKSISSRLGYKTNDAGDEDPVVIPREKLLLYPSLFWRNPSLYGGSRASFPTPSYSIDYIVDVARHAIVQWSATIKFSKQNEDELISSYGPMLRDAKLDCVLNYYARVDAEPLSAAGLSLLGELRNCARFFRLQVGSLTQLVQMTEAVICALVKKAPLAALQLCGFIYRKIRHLTNDNTPWSFDYLRNKLKRRFLKSDCKKVLKWRKILPLHVEIECEDAVRSLDLQLKKLMGLKKI